MTRTPPQRQVALTGPCAAALLGLDGFRDLEWGPAWCTKHIGRTFDYAIQTRLWRPPTERHGHEVAHPTLVLRHLGRFDLRPTDSMTARDRIELAVEHALRDKLVELGDLRVGGGANEGDRLIRQILKLRKNEPPTESFAETRWIQLLRKHGLTCWRQVPVLDGTQELHRVDTVVPFNPRRPRPTLLRPTDGVLVEVDSREFHEHRFEEDHRRSMNYDRLNFHWIAITANQIEHRPNVVMAALRGAFQRARQDFPAAA